LELPTHRYFKYRPDSDKFIISKPPASRMIICPNCEQANPSNAKSCQNCWHGLDETMPVSQSVAGRPVDELVASAERIDAGRQTGWATPDTSVAESKIGAQTQLDELVRAVPNGQKREMQNREQMPGVRWGKVATASIAGALGGLGIFVLLFNDHKVPESQNHIMRSEGTPLERQQVAPVATVSIRPQKQTNPYLMPPAISITPVPSISQPSPNQERAVARVHVTPTAIPLQQVILSGQSTSAPEFTQCYLPPVGRLAVKRWVWGPGRMYGTTELISTGTAMAV
jgi:hypothetical protein